MKFSKITKILSLILVLMLVSCGSAVKQADLIGKWTEEENTIVEGLPVKSIEFFEDGKVMIADEYPGTYKILDNGDLEVTLVDGVYQGPVEIDGDTLTISKEDGTSKNYIKE